MPSSRPRTTATATSTVATQAARHGTAIPTFQTAGGHPASSERQSEAVASCVQDQEKLHDNTCTADSLMSKKCYTTFVHVLITWHLLFQEMQYDTIDRDRPGISHHTTRHEEEALKIPGLVSYRLGGLPHRRLPLFFFHVATPDALFGKFWIGGEGEGLKSNLVYFRLNPLHSSVIQTSPEGVRDEERADACGQGRGARTATRLPRNAIRHSDPV